MSSFKALGATAIRVTALEPVAFSKSDLAMLKPKVRIPTSSISLGHYHRRHHHHRHRCQQQQHPTSELESHQRYSNCLSFLRRHHQDEKQHGRLLGQAFFSTFMLRRASTFSKRAISANTSRSLSSPSSSAPASAAAMTSATSNVGARSAQASGPYGSKKQPVLNWNEFLLLRRRRRVTGLVCSIVTALASTATGISVATARDLDSAAAAAMGLDPLIVLAIGTMSFAGIGWLAGPFVGNIFFAVFARRRGVWKEFIAVCGCSLVSRDLYLLNLLAI